MGSTSSADKVGVDLTNHRLLLRRLALGFAAVHRLARHGRARARLTEGTRRHASLYPGCRIHRRRRRTLWMDRPQCRPVLASCRVVPLATLRCNAAPRRGPTVHMSCGVVTSMACAVASGLVSLPAFLPAFACRHRRSQVLKPSTNGLDLGRDLCGFVARFRRPHAAARFS